MIRELQVEVAKYKESSASVPEVSHVYEQKIRRLEIELQAAAEERRQAAQEVIRLQSQLSDSEHSRRGQKEVLAHEVRLGQMGGASRLIHVGFRVS